MLFRSTVRFKRKGQTDEIQGISFSKGEYTFKGSEIDRSFSFSKLDKCFGYAGMNVAGSQRQTTFAPVREQAPAPGKADSPLLTGSLGLFSASSPPVDEEPNFNLRKKKKKKKRLNPAIFPFSSGIADCYSITTCLINFRFVVVDTVFVINKTWIS